jgi:hypothetical protein
MAFSASHCSSGRRRRRWRRASILAPATLASACAAKVSRFIVVPSHVFACLRGHP